MKFYQDVETERDRIETCIQKYGHTSDHNLDWWTCAIINADGASVFIEWPDGRGLLAHRYPDKWRIWSDPLSLEPEMAHRAAEFSSLALEDNKIKEIWCDDVSDKIYPELKQNQTLKLNDVYYSLLWPVLDMAKYDSSLPGGHFKEIRNARNKFYKEHKVESVNPEEIGKELLHKIVNEWKNFALKKQKEEDISELKYHKAIDNDFNGFLNPRVILVDGKPIGFNAGYEVVSRRSRFAGIMGIHNYSLNDLGTILWLEDLDWVKNRGYKEFDMQGSEDDGGLKLKLRFGAAVERKTDTFSIQKYKNL